ncbi:hypothetical protein ANN_07961 [Periplaneta americana]|uniref:glucose-6-phosphatase n=1 Tax=Periplaneta americana TaxID=6978 RepID=A0ABQ8T1G6_PERAM|nr:hypothetical protein ANN_07961 [Periplaneta americana]
MLMDHRPFWWVQETTVYGKGLRPALRQTPLTCETGPGSPSGHVQGASALMYVVLQHVLRASKGRLSDGRRRYLAMTLWMLYMILMVLVGASRLYTATHFPHQTLLGLVAGDQSWHGHRGATDARIYGPVYDRGEWRKRTNKEVDQLLEGENIVSFIKSIMLRWLGHVMIMEEGWLPKMMNARMEGERRGRPKKRWMDDILRDVTSLGVRNWRTGWGQSEISENTVVKSFLKYGISSALVGSEDHFLYESKDEDSCSDDDFNGSNQEETSDYSDGSEFKGFWSIPPKMLLASVVMIAVSFGAYWLQRLMGVDPQWSVRLAFKWCERPEWIHVNTTPLFSLVRDCGSMFGIALAAPNNTRVRSQPRHNVVIGMVCTLSLMLAFQMAADAVPTSDVRLFYGCQFMLHAVKPFLLFLGIPRIARLAKHKQH